MARKKTPKQRLAPPPEHPPHLVGYARVSTREQHLDMQIAALRRAGVAEGDIYVDKGKSGARVDRDGLNSALKACRPAEHGRPASKLLVWKIDRVSRSLIDLLMLAEAMRDRGVELVSLTESVDTSTAWGEFMFGLMGLLAQLERKMTLERTYAGLEHARSEGRIGGAPRLHDEEAERKIARAYWDRPERMSHREHVKRLAKLYDMTSQSIYNIRDRWPLEKPAALPAPKTKLWAESIRRLKHAKA